MKSSTGAYFIALDHVRALAAFLVFYWHFNSINEGQFAAPSWVPSILTEGHTGVAVFMTLSGYLFAKILDGKNIDYLRFVWNRCIRLLPLLFFVLFVICINRFFNGENLWWYIKHLLKGPVFPTLPHGGWSITVEFHFYLLLPAILWMARKNKAWLFSILLVAILARLAFFLNYGTVQIPTYWTIMGRIDNFLLGVIGYYFNTLISGRNLAAIVVATSFLLFYRWFDSMGGFYKWGDFPSTSPIWIVMPTIEGFSYAALIAWYDTSFRQLSGAASRFIARIGEASYSIYLLHYFFVHHMASFIQRFVFLEDGLPRFFSAVVCFLLVVPIAMLSYRFIEVPFLKYRVKYIRPTPPNIVAVAGA